MTDMPSFDFSSCSFTDGEALAEAEKANSGGGGSVFKPGKYDARIAAALYRGPCKGDPTWGDFQLDLEGAGGKSIRAFIQVPFRDFKFGSKGTLFPFRKTKALLAALGYSTDFKDVPASMKACFAKPEKLVGRTVAIDVGYERSFVHYAGKAPSGAKRYVIMDQDKNPVRDAQLNVVEFPDFESAMAWAEEKKLDVDKFPRVLAFEASAGKPAVDASPLRKPW